MVVSGAEAEIALTNDLYGVGGPGQLSAATGATAQLRWPAEDSHGWYDFAVVGGENTIHFAGRVEDGSDSYSDPLLTV